MKRLVIALAAFFVSSTALAKPLYITVPRTYGTAESPVVDVAFGEHEAVELRVLKPKDLDAFIQSQSNLRRAYEPPTTQVNPGRYLSRGLNSMRAPGKFLLFSHDKKFRDEVGEVIPDGAEISGPPVSKLQEGPRRLIGLPPGMELVKSHWLNLDLGGSERTFNVPGFQEWGGKSGFQERRVTIDPLPAGVYVIQLVQGRIEGQVVLVVTDLTTQVKQTDGKVLVRVAGRDQKPKANAEVKVFARSGAPVTGKTNGKGEALLTVADPKVLVTAKLGTDVALIDTDFYSTLAIAPDVFVYTDRPIYRPGDAVSYRGVVRKPDSGFAQLFRPKSRSVNVTLFAGDQRLGTEKASVDEFGSFHGSISTLEGLETGVLRVVATLDEQAHNAEARVQEYVKPTFYVEVLTEQESVAPGDTIKAKARARRYSGTVPDGTGYEVFLYRTVLDTPAWVDDAGLGGQGSAVTYGSASTTEGVLSVPKRLYSTVVERLGEGASEDPWESAPTFDENGEAEVSVVVPALAADDDRVPFKYTLTVRARDDQGTFANASKPFFSADSDVMANLRPSAKVTLTGSEAVLSVRAVTLGGRAFGETEGEVEWVLRDADGAESSLAKEPIKTAADGTWRGKVPTKKVGTVLARVTLKDKKGRPWSGESAVIVAGMKGEAVQRVPVLTADALDAVVAPGELAQVVALFPEEWGPGGKNEGPVWITLQGTTVHETKLLDVSGSTLVHKFVVERRFGTSVYASLAYPTANGRWEERVVPFRVLPTERTLTVSITPRTAEAAPLAKQTLDLRVTDHRGRGVPAQVSAGVVDKAIYALQTEIRPGVLQFFYPLIRDNVTSYYSSEFQGYGYGEFLAKAGHKARAYEFAAVKPPTKKQESREKDTAYWNPAIVTDADGRASVTFELPSNQTLWVVTAVAADVNGRFGEGTSEFATRGAMTLVSSLPQFLRAGDEATGSVRVSRGTKKTDKAGEQLIVALDLSGALGAEKKTESIGALAAGAEKVVPLSLKTTGEGAGRVAVRLDGGTNVISDKRDVPVKAATIDEIVSVAAWGGGDLNLTLPSGAQIEAVELSLGASSVEMALASVRDLLDYPYGCLEQLIATTIPNVAVYSTLDKVGALDGLDPESRALLSEARSRAVQGIDRILDLEVKGGGFGWFPGYEKPTIPLTLIALDGLAYAADVGLVDASEPRIAESAAWLAARQDVPSELEPTRTYVLARLQGDKQAPRARALVENVSSGDLYGIALAVLAAEETGIAKEPAVRQKLGALVEQSRKGVAQLTSWEPESAVFWDYPLRRPGMAAILAHAASTGEGDVGTIRTRLVQVLASSEEMSTFDRSQFLLHSQWLIERDAKAMRTMTPPSVKVAGADPLFAPRGAGLVAKLDMKSAGSKVKIGEFDGVATLRAQVKTPLASVKAVNDGMFVERTYWVLRGNQKVKLADGASVSQGEEVFVELTVDAKGGKKHRSAYWVLEDSIPAGFVALQEDKEWRAAPWSLPLTHEAMKRRAFTPERATFFFHEPVWWSDSPRVVGYVLRAQFPGKFVAPPAKVEDMYSARSRGRTASATLSISAKK